MANNKELDALLQILAGEQTIIQRTDQKAFTLLSILGAFMVFFIVHFTKMQLDMVIFSLIMIYFPAAMGTIYFLVRVLRESKSLFKTTSSLLLLKRIEENKKAIKSFTMLL